MFLQKTKYSHKVRWGVILSDGSTFYEGEGIFKDIKGKLSPTQRLLARMADNRLKIVDLWLHVDKKITFHLPSTGELPNITMLHKQQVPIDYNVFRYIDAHVNRSGVVLGREYLKQHFTVIEAIFGTYKLQLWVDENYPHNCHTHILPL